MLGLSGCSPDARRSSSFVELIRFLKRAVTAHLERTRQEESRCVTE
jgi:hypothetical protein